MAKLRTILTAIGACTAAFCGSFAHANAPLTPDEKDWLTAHNEARANFGTSPLKWSDELSKEAHAWAEQLARENTIRHSPQEARERTGENLWMGTSGYFAATQMIDYFVDEKRYFRAGQFPNVSTTGNWADVGHYTQIVWADTREVGCAKASNGRNDVLVCRYFPGGNVLGQTIAPQRKLARR